MEAVETLPDEKITTMQVAEPEKKEPAVKNDNLIAKFENRNLRYDFSAAEVHEIGMQLVNKTQEKETVIAAKKSATATYTAKEKEISATINILATQFKDGHEYRDVKCEVVYNKPENGKKTLIRSDTKEGDPKRIIIEKMTQFDFNLFTQPKDKNAEKTDFDIQDSDHLEKDTTAKNKGKFVKGRQSTDILNRMETGEDKPSKSTASNTKKGKGKRVAQSADAPSGIVHEEEEAPDPSEYIPEEETLKDEFPFNETLSELDA